MRGFIHRHLDAADRLGEILFGLIMALGFTGAVRLGHEEADSRALFTGILGCNIAWAVVDGVMYAIGELFERGRRARLGREVQAAPDDAEALRIIASEYDPHLESLAGAGKRDELYREMLTTLRSSEIPPARIHKEDILSATAVALVILLSTLPVVAPYLIFKDPERAVRISNAVALLQLFLLGLWWGRMVRVGSLKIGIGLTAVGMLLVGITIALGG
jgi:VIT1/CCC1 family predicted Fe2+/Mn2+ transporter